MELKTAKALSVKDVRINGGFWRKVQKQLDEKMLPYQWKALNDQTTGEKSHCIANFKAAAGLSEERLHYGRVFQDSDAAKWIEAVSYRLMAEPNQALESLADECIDIIAAAQMEDGYLNTYHQLTDISKRWSNLRDQHELYCAGHMIEAAVAYYQATGKRKLLDVVIRLSEHISRVIGPEEGKIHGYPGHQEIELALCKLYDVTRDERFLSLAHYFIDERGKEPYFFEAEAAKRGDKPPRPGGIVLGRKYNQTHLPIVQQKTAEGHSVRALYMAAGMADVAMRTQDRALFQACKALFDNIADRRMYITGGIGSSRIGEAFTCDYDLPNDFVYAETCASIALIFFCQRMLLMEQDSRYADVIERVLYNTCLAGMSHDQTHFFYVNPLSVDPFQSAHNHAKAHVLPVRPEWYACACCPPNLARLFASLGQYQYTVVDDQIYMHLFLTSETRLNLPAGNVTVTVETDYPRESAVRFTVDGGSSSMFIRKPWWCDRWTVKRNGAGIEPRLQNGYLVLSGPFDSDRFEIQFDMEPRRVYSNLKVRSNIGRVAVMRGPLVYCLEEKDNAADLQQVFLPKQAALKEEQGEGLFADSVLISTFGIRITQKDDQGLYFNSQELVEEQVPLTFIPYSLWGNRGKNEMEVWVRERD